MENNEIAGIDLQQGLRIVNNNKKLYLKLLGNFSNNPMLDPLLEAIQTGDMKLSASKAHAIKGVAANLGLESILALIKALEARMLAEEEIKLDDIQVEELRSAYAVTIESIGKLNENPEYMDLL